MSTVDISPLLPRPSLASWTDHTHTHTHTHRHQTQTQTQTHTHTNTHTHGHTHTHTHTHTHRPHQTASMSMMPVTHRTECSAILAPLVRTRIPPGPIFLLGYLRGRTRGARMGSHGDLKMRTAIVSTRQLPAIPALFAMNRISCSFDSPLEAFERDRAGARTPRSPWNSARSWAALPAPLPCPNPR